MATNDDELLADCQARFAFDLLAHTWDSVVLFALGGGRRRPGELRVSIGGLSAKVLTQSLRRLEFSGLVVRHDQSPARVEYELTDLGTSLLEPVRVLAQWSFDHTDEVLAAQERSEALAR